MVTNAKTITVFVSNKPIPVAEGSPFVDTIQQLATNCNLRDFTLVIDGKTVNEGELVPDKITRELHEKIMLIPYDRAAERW